MTRRGSMSSQKTLPGILKKPSSAELKALVKYKMHGFEARQAARVQRRAEVAAKARQAARHELDRADNRTGGGGQVNWLNSLDR